MVFKVGDRVILPANAEEGWPEERGEVIEVQDQAQWPGMLVVGVDEEYLGNDGDDDDGIREVHENDVQPDGTWFRTRLQVVT